jgi:hypothetical protein
MNISVAREDERWTLRARDAIEDCRIRTVEGVRRFLADRGHSLSDTQHHGLGTAAALIAVDEYSGQYASEQLGKVLDSIYFPYSETRRRTSLLTWPGRGSLRSAQSQ